ncbi:hypothetical protein T440DRAFT_501970 [Plenodomus tracheiphilus IPT5]|uniref:Zn(2)-C6 fungal-type domain-containing protein n=1 Tax=Plenodomus tracheiphilus IPT5 TaxID=1408161 RepID=A0A6A7ASD8_9PLEO|nr:hypothetical protein T440DRAFT_501970 [Plenodomus tracheiphilus IPT5]
MTLAGAAKHQCTTCNKVFKNSNHLRRHEASHTQGTTHACTFCSRKFLRLDALRRHSKTCPRREHGIAIPASKLGRKPRACHQCQSKKLQCDGSRPCRRCSSKNIDCLYSPAIEERPLSSHLPINFLRNYTNPDLESVSDAFLLSEAHPELSPDFGHSFGGGASYIHGDWIEDLFSGVLPEFHVSYNMEPDIIATAPSTLELFASPPLQVRAEALVSLLATQHISDSKSSACSMGHFPMSQARAVFTCSNIVEYVSAFFSYFHPHTPFIHRPSFDVENVSFPLLLAVSLVGSLFCTPQDNALAARLFFGLAEECIFNLLHKATMSRSCVADKPIQILQASVLMHAVQMNSNNDGVRLRIRELRFPAIVSSLRRLDLLKTTRKPHSESRSYEEFIHEEEKIRLVASVFQTDCMSTLFFKSSPHITITEMCGALPSDVFLFDAPTPAEFLDFFTGPAPFVCETRSLKDTMSILLHQAWSGPHAPELASIGSEHLITLMFALHSLIFTSRTGLLMPSTHDVLLRATDRWKDLWELVQSRNNAEKRRPIGFTKYGLELWWLAQKILKLAQREDTQSPYMTSKPTDSLKELHEFIQRYAERE